MLSRTADHLYWMSRYIERAESLARLVDAHYRMSLLPQSGDTLAQSLSATMTALHMERAYLDRHDAIEPRAVFEFVSLDRGYSGSIVSCLRSARENARAVRGSLTSELWETLNSTWLEARSLRTRHGARADIGEFVEWVKERSHLTRGVTIGTMLRDEAYHFTRIGTFLERADSTARILTAHQSDLEPGADAVAVPDPYEWSVLLRALSAFEVYRRVYRDVITPFRVAQLLILRDDMPRSLLRCCKEVYQNLQSVSNEQSQETERRAGEIHAMLHFTRMEAIIADGLPRFLQQFLARLRDLGDRIACDFLVPPVEAEAS
jgi:uncharacterized alpha-E superfamily protein